MENLNQRQDLKDDFGLKYLLREPKVISEEKPVFIFLHGVGSNEKDLFGLADLLPDNFTVLSVRSPYTMGYDSYSFYEIDYSTGVKIINVEEAEKSRNLLHSFIRGIIEKYKIAPDKVYLGGFSQGGIMSYGVSLTFPGLVKAMVSFSGRILDEVKPLVKANDNLKNLKVFVAHGVYDNVVPVTLARESKNYLESLNIHPDYYEFNGEHEIPQVILSEFKNWVEKVSSQYS